MTASANGKPRGKGMALIAFIPENAFSPQITVIAQWHTGTGVVCPPQEIPVRGLQPPEVAKLFVAMIRAGIVRQRVQQEDSSWVECPLPTLHFVIGDPAGPPGADPADAPEEPPAPRKIVLPGE